jgi:hypothetical protein
MAGPVVHEPATAGRLTPKFGNATRDDLPGFLGIMRIIHQEPNSSAFARLLLGQPKTEDEIPLAHLFEEISTLALHGLIVEDLLFDAFAFDYYWEQLKGAVDKARERTSNRKFCENFEQAARLAIAYRETRPAKSGA